MIENSKEDSNLHDEKSNEIYSTPIYERSLKFHSDTVSQIVFNPNNKSLASSSNDNSILVWDLTANPQSKPKRLVGHKSLVNDLAISPTGFQLASASSDHTVRVWSNILEEEETQCAVIKHNSAPVKSVDFSCDSKLLVTGSDDKSVKIINVADKKLSATLTSHTNWIKCVRFSQDAKLIASSSDDKTVKIWDVNKKTLNYTLSNVHNGVINAVRFHPDNSLIGTACFDKKVRLFDVRSKQLVQVYDQHKKPVTSLAFHPQGIYLASTSYDESIKIFDLRNGKVLYTLAGHEGPSTSVNFSHFGDYLATGGADALIILWKTNLNIESPVNDYYAFPLDNDSQIQPLSSENVFSFQQNKSSLNKQTCQNEGTLNYKNVHNVHPYNNSLILDQAKENISEELSKVFEKMVNQLELITNTFKNFENRLTTVEDMLDDIKIENQNDEKVNNLYMQKELLENQISEQLNHMHTIKNNLKSNMTLEPNSIYDKYKSKSFQNY